jgi:hypothetical protein
LNGGTDISVTQSGGYLTFTPSGTGTKTGFYGKSITDGDYVIAMPAVYPNSPDWFGLFIADNAGNYIMIDIDKSASPNYRVGIYSGAAWNFGGTPSVSISYADPRYIGLRYWNDNGTRKVSFAFSWDGKNWSTPYGNWAGITSGVPSTVAYVGIYCYLTNATTHFKAPSYSVNWIRFN